MERQQAKALTCSRQVIRQGATSRAEISRRSGRTDVASTMRLQPFVRIASTVLAARIATTVINAARHAPIRSLVTVSDTFDAGNIECISASDDLVKLKIKPDPFTEQPALKPGASPCFLKTDFLKSQNTV